MPAIVYVILFVLVSFVCFFFFTDTPPNTSANTIRGIRIFLGTVWAMMLIPMGFIIGGKEIEERKEVEVFHIRNKLYYFDDDNDTATLSYVTSPIVLKEGMNKLIKVEKKFRYTFFSDTKISVEFVPVESKK